MGAGSASRFRGTEEDRESHQSIARLSRCCQIKDSDSIHRRIVGEEVDGRLFDKAPDRGSILDRSETVIHA